MMQVAYTKFKTKPQEEKRTKSSCFGHRLKWQAEVSGQLLICRVTGEVPHSTCMGGERWRDWIITLHL